MSEYKCTICHHSSSNSDYYTRCKMNLSTNSKIFLYKYLCIRCSEDINENHFFNCARCKTPFYLSKKWKDTKDDIMTHTDGNIWQMRYEPIHHKSHIHYRYKICSKCVIQERGEPPLKKRRTQYTQPIELTFTG